MLKDSPQQAIPIFADACLPDINDIFIAVVRFPEEKINTALL